MMPAYISHAIMGENLYNEAKKVDELKTDISSEEFRGFSLGADLAIFSKKLLKDPHNFYTRDFFLYLINYIKNNKLECDNSIMALLYGHMAHYFFDLNAHPFIYYIECGCKREGLISNHDLVEGYLSSYLAKEILNKDIMEFKASYFNQICLEDKVSKILNTTYGKIYGDYNIILSYKKVIFLFSFIENLVKCGVFSKDFLIKFSSFEKFLKVNNLSFEELLNIDNNVFLNPITGNCYCDSFMDLYNRAIDMSLEAIGEVNKVLYDGYSDDNLGNIFKDLSYDTGENCSLGNKFVYVRKK